MPSTVQDPKAQFGKPAVAISDDGRELAGTVVNGDGRFEYTLAVRWTCA